MADQGLEGLIRASTPLEEWAALEDIGPGRWAACLDLLQSSGQTADRAKQLLRLAVATGEADEAVRASGSTDEFRGELLRVPVEQQSAERAEMLARVAGDWGAGLRDARLVEKALDLAQHAVAAAESGGDADALVGALGALGFILNAAFERAFVNDVQRERGRRALVRADELAHGSDSGVLVNLSIAHHLAFRATGLPDHLDDAIEVAERGLTQVPAGHRHRAALATGAAQYYAERYRFQQQYQPSEASLSDLDIAVGWARDAVAEARFGTPHWAGTRSNLSSFLWERYDRSGDERDIEDAIALTKEALADPNLPRSHWFRVVMTANLGGMAYSRYRRHRDEPVGRAHLEQAIAYATDALDATQVSDGERTTRVGNALIVLLERALVEDAVLQGDVGQLGRLSTEWLNRIRSGTSTSFKFSDLRAAPSIAGLAAAAAEKGVLSWNVARDVGMAVLERAEELTASAPSQRVEGVDPAIVVRGAVDGVAGVTALALSESNKHAEAVAILESSIAVTARRHLQEPLAHRATDFSAVRRSTSGSVTWLAATPVGCVVLQLRADGSLAHNVIKGLTAETVEAMHGTLHPARVRSLPAQRTARFRSPSDAVAPSKASVEEVTNEMSRAVRLFDWAAPGDTPSWVVPTGPLALLPWQSVLPHAYVHLSARLIHDGSGNSPKGIVAFVDPTEDLQGARDEGALLKEKWGAHVLSGPDATVSAFLNLFPDVGVLHFAAHGLAEPAVRLAGDRRLGLRELAARDDLLRVLRLLFLNCCVSAATVAGARDEALGFATVASASGTQAVVHVLWPVDDHEAMAYAEQFYAYLNAGKDVVGAARAARDYLRDSYPDSGACHAYEVVGS